MPVYPSSHKLPSQSDKKPVNAQKKNKMHKHHEKQNIASAASSSQSLPAQEQSSVDMLIGSDEIYENVSVQILPKGIMGPEHESEELYLNESVCNTDDNNGLLLSKLDMNLDLEWEELYVNESVGNTDNNGLPNPDRNTGLECDEIYMNEPVGTIGDQPVLNFGMDPEAEDDEFYVNEALGNSNQCLSYSAKDATHECDENYINEPIWQTKDIPNTSP